MKQLVNDLQDEEAKHVTQFNERAERWIDLAQLSLLYGLDGAGRYVIRAADCIIGYGWRKDVWIFDVLSAVESVHQAGSANVQPWLETLAPFIDQITTFTDGDETNHAPEEFIDVVAQAKPEWLAVLMCTTVADLPSSDEVRRNIKKSSILADLLFQRIYRKPLGGWLSNHSGPAPFGYQAERYFEEYKGQVVPLILSTDFQRLQDKYGFPFQEQWAFEWRNLMDATNSPHSSFPYHFIDAAQNRRGVSGQFSQSQCNVYRSAFLRTLAFGPDA